MELNAVKTGDLSQREVADLLGVSREYVSRMTNHPSESKRLPAYGLGRRRTYDRAKVLWWRENHLYTPIRKKGKA